MVFTEYLIRFFNDHIRKKHCNSTIVNKIISTSGSNEILKCEFNNWKKRKDIRDKSRNQTTGIVLIREINETRSYA